MTDRNRDQAVLLATLKNVLLRPAIKIIQVKNMLVNAALSTIIDYLPGCETDYLPEYKIDE